MLLGIAAATLACAASDATDWSEKAIQLYRAGHFSEAEAAYRRALDAYDRSGEGATLARALTLENIAVMLRAEGRYAESANLHLEALPRIEELAGPDSLQAARAASNLAALYGSMGKVAEAEALAARAERVFGALPPGNGPEHSANQHVLASIFVAQHRYAEAERLLRATLRDAHSVNTVVAYSNLAAASLGVNENVRAEEYARQAVALAQSELRPGHPLAAVALNNLAQACRFQGKNLEAENSYREAISIWEHALGDRHPDLARGLMNLAAFYHDRGREAGAEDLYQRAGAIFEEALGSKSAEALVVHGELADVLRAQRRYTEAEKLSRATLAAMRGQFAAGDPRLLRAEGNDAHLRDEAHSGKAKREAKVAAFQ
ncbi:MAG: tetratricopeptide repeat protein [Candidatus Solibacter sp.]